MASTKLMETKDGRRFFQISVSRGYGKSAYKIRWYWPDGWSKRTAERELAKVAAEFERACAAGEVLNRAEAKKKAADEAAELARLKTFRQYADGVFMPVKEATFSENARSSYRMFFDKHILPVLGDTLLTDITPAMVTKLLVDFQKAGYSHATAVKLYNILNGVFEVVDVGEDVLVLLRQLRDEQSVSCISKWCFTQDGTAEPMFPQSPTKYFKKFGERYGVKDFHPHKLRHTSASVAITNGADVVSVSERLGHSDTAITLRLYSHANEESIRRAGQTVRDAVKKAQNG